MQELLQLAQSGLSSGILCPKASVSISRRSHFQKHQGKQWYLGYLLKEEHNPPRQIWGENRDIGRRQRK